MTPIKRNITFVPEVKKDKKGTKGSYDGKLDILARVRCVITWNGLRVRLNLGLDVCPDDWEPKVQRCAAKTYHGAYKTPASRINREIDDFEVLVDDIFRDFEEADTVPTREQFMEAYDRIQNPDKYKEGKEDAPIADRPLFPIYDEFVREGRLSGRWTASTFVKRGIIRKYLYNISRKLTLNQLIRGGVLFVIRHFSEGEKLSNVTMNKYIDFVKTFLFWAQEKGYCDATPFTRQKVKLKTVAKPVIFLEWDELMDVYNHDFKGSHLEAVRDVFCFCCFTSLRYSDVYNLRKSNIVNNEIRITTVKTHDSLVIELNKYSRAILDKYADMDFPKGKALPVISNQKMNDYLKEVGSICKINEPITLTSFKGSERTDTTYPKWQLLTTHAGRRTFVCNALMLGVPANVVMKWTGHSDYKSMRPYIAIADKTKKTAMSVFDRMGEDNELQK